MNEAAGGEVFVGGLVVKESGQWYCNDGVHYHYAMDSHVCIPDMLFPLPTHQA